MFSEISTNVRCTLSLIKSHTIVLQFNKEYKLNTVSARGRMTQSYYFWRKYYLRSQNAKKLILTIGRNECRPTSLPQTSTSPLQRICFSCRNEQYTTYSDSKHLKMTNKQLKSAIVIMNMHQTNQLTFTPQIFNENTPLHVFFCCNCAFPFVYMEPT